MLGCPDEERSGFGHYDPPPDGATVRCPVSDKSCPKTPLTPSAIVESKTYYFCCPDCRGTFVANPTKYVGN